MKNVCVPSCSRPRYRLSAKKCFLCFKRGRDLNFSFQMDIVVDQTLIVEVKSVGQVEPVHEAQLLTCMRLSGISLGLLMNFNSAMLKDGIRRKRI